MKTEQIEIIKGLFENTNLIMKLEKTIKYTLGYGVNLIPEYGKSWVYLNECCDSDGFCSTARSMRKEPITMYLFKTAQLQISVWPCSEDKSITFAVSVRYQHNDGGSNGHDLFKIVYYTDDDIMIVK